jgi:hypothetical protein
MYSHLAIDTYRMALSLIDPTSARLGLSENTTETYLHAFNFKDGFSFPRLRHMHVGPASRPSMAPNSVSPDLVEA